MADVPAPRPPNTPPPLPPSAVAPPPLPRPRRERLPGTYAGNYLDVDPSPTMGGVVTAGLFTLAFVLELVHLMAAVLTGYTLDTDVSVLFRVGLFSLALIVLWLGAAPARWFLSVWAFLNGAWLLIWTIAAGSAANLGSYLNLSALPLGFTYLMIFFYVGFSSNVVAFAKSQRVPGKAFSVLRIVALCVVALGGTIAVRPLAIYWSAAERASAQRFAEESVRAISAHWEPREFDARADAKYVADWPVGAKKAVMQSMSRYGAVQTFGETRLNLHNTFDVDHGFHWHCMYSSDDGFEHGDAIMALEMEHAPFSPWRITAWSLMAGTGPTPTPVPAATTAN